MKRIYYFWISGFIFLGSSFLLLSSMISVSVSLEKNIHKFDLNRSDFILNPPDMSTYEPLHYRNSLYVWVFLSVLSFLFCSNEFVESFIKMSAFKKSGVE